MIVIHNADIHVTVTDSKLIKDNVFHKMRHVMPAEADSGVSKTCVLTVVLARVVKVVLSFYIPSSAFSEEKGIQQTVEVRFGGLAGDRAPSAVSSGFH